MSIKTEAIILRERTYRGADRIYDVLTPAYGKLAVVARGAAKSSSKMAGHVPQFAEVRLMIGRGRNDHLAGAVTVRGFRGLRDSWFNFILAASLVELVLVVNAPGEVAHDEYHLLRTAFGLLESTRERSERVKIARIFLWKMLALSGWRPNLDHCVVCRHSLDDALGYYRSTVGFVCTEHGTDGIPLNSELVKCIRETLDNGDWVALARRFSSREIDRQWLEVSQLYYQDILSRPLRSSYLFNYT